MQVGSWALAEDLEKLSADEYEAFLTYIRLVGFTAYEKWCGYDLLCGWSAVYVDQHGDATCANLKYSDPDPNLQIDLKELRRIVSLGALS